MIKRFIGIAAIAVLMVSCNEQKTAYVDTTKLIKEYKEMEDVQATFTSKTDSLRKQLDSVGRAFQQEVQEYQQGMKSMSESERQQKEQELMRKQQMIQQSQQMQSNRLREESNAVMDSMVNKVKGYVKEYGEKNGYTYIFGSNESGNIMYGKEDLDITDEILEKLNKDYGGGAAEDTSATE
ncbi:hypothetical protein C7S20_05935 [Christiangramia fulva]|uniref:OmpH family outer membrane protein n=1 Tax=Christiangramia fulva TaxID=2126553 RepID=A0A2R3Z3K4_9FLAO|nr:OmpH family outer membrane protein [Christiangramia fulva]AVR44841.1 hypothetical protein C7S20_05935 [Christiangramia fulva]